MNKNNILSSDVLDILFENRNKQYGAYILRKFYPNRVKTSLFIMLGLATVFSAFTMVPAGSAKTDGNSIDSTLTVYSLKEIKQPEQPAKKVTVQQKTVQQQQFTSRMEIVENDKPTTPLNDISQLTISDHTETDGPPGESEVVIPAGESGGGMATTPPVEPAADPNAVVESPDIQASYPGGAAALTRFLQKNLSAPEESNEMVEVLVKFVVGFDGELESFDIVKSGGDAFSGEVIRVLKKMPKWNPGKKGGRNVRVYYYLPVKFQPLD